MTRLHFQLQLQTSYFIPTANLITGTSCGSPSTPAPVADPPPHGPPHGPPQRRAAPHVHGRRDQRVQTRHDSEQVGSLVSKYQAVPRQLSDDYVGKGGAPERQEDDDHEHDDAQRLLLVVPLGARRLPD